MLIDDGAEGGGSMVGSINSSNSVKIDARRELNLTTLDTTPRRVPDYEQLLSAPFL